MLRSLKNLHLKRSSRQHVRWLCALIIAALLLAKPSAMCAEDTPKSSDAAAIQELVRANQELVSQIQDLQNRVKQLEAKVSASSPAESSAVLSAQPVGTSSTAVAAAATPTAAVSIQEPEKETSSSGVKLRLFGDAGYSVSDHKGQTNAFKIGSLDLLMTGSLSDRVSVLGEVLFIPLNNNAFEADIERLLLQYKHNDYFTFAVGRYHSSIGYYNTAFHRGAWFQTAIDRPFMYAFDDHGGFLPLQEVGVTVNGQIPSGKLGLHYVAEIGNGRSHLLGSEPAQNAHDSNNGKSFNIALFARPSWFPGWQAGFSIYHDFLTFSDNINHSELISTVHLVYRSSNYEFLNEGMLVSHGRTMSGDPGVFHTPAVYTQISRKFGNFRPYFRYAYINAGVNEPIYGDSADGPLVGRRNGPTIGLRYDFNDHAAFKLQYDHLASRGPTTTNGLGAQLSFGF
jgi:hypothetical protein